MKLTAILLATALLWASHVPASGQLRNVTDNAAGISYNANSKTILGAYYFIHRESGSDFLVQMTDQSTKCGWGIVLHK